MRPVAALWLLPLAGCVGVWGASQHVYLALPTLSGAEYGGSGALAVLRGTRLCPLFCATDDLATCTDTLQECYEFGVYGCHVVDQLGLVQMPVIDTCGGVDDEVSFDVYARGEVRAALVDWEALGDDLFGVGYRYEWAAQDLRLAGRFGVTPTLVGPSDQPVAFETAGSSLQVTAGEVQRDGLDYVTVPPGVQASLTLEVGGDVFRDFGSVLGVDPSEAASIEVQAGYDPDGQPRGARAIVRDGQDRLMYGVPVSWVVTSGAVVLDSAGLPGPDFVQVLDVCVPPDENVGPREAELHASYGVLGDSVRVTWTGPGGAADPAWERSDRCPPDLTGTTTTDPTDTEPATSDPDTPTGRATRGASRARSGRCGCDGADVGGLAAWVALGLVVVRRRRR